MITTSGNGHAPAFICRCGELNTEAAETIAALEAALVARQCTINALNAELADKRLAHKHREAVERIAMYWNLRIKNGRATAAAKGKRFDHTAARLAEGWTEDQLRTAIDGSAYDPVVVEGKTHNDLKYLMSDAAIVQKHIDRAPSEDAVLAGLWLDEGPSDWFWLDVEIEKVREEIELQHHIREVDRLRREILAGEGSLLDRYRQRHELRVAM